MSRNPIVRAWKNEEFRNSLSAAELAALPAHPAGLVELTSDELVAVTGSQGQSVTSIPCLLDDLKYTKDGGTFCGTKDITCPPDRRGAVGGSLRS